MFTVYHSNQLDSLKSLVAFHIENQPLRDPFQSEIVLVQSPGMAQWLQMSLAEYFGIAANIEFPLAATFIWDMFVCALPDLPKESVFSKDKMSWKLMVLLPQMLGREEFTALNHYLSDDHDKRKLFRLSAKIAELFNQYLIYRPDWLNCWEQGEQIADLDESQQWQAPLWVALVEYTRQTGQPEQHQANLYSRFISMLDKGDKRPAGLPDRVFIFGISALPPIYLQALQALGKHIDIHLLFSNPCRFYWGDIQDYTFLAQLQSRSRRHFQRHEESSMFRDVKQASSLFDHTGKQQLSNPLLASCGKLGRDNLYLLTQMNAQEIDAFVDIAADTLLKAIQRDILELDDKAVVGENPLELKNSANKRKLSLDDRSIALHICHSPQREVEVLQDRLLAMMADDHALFPRDIIVMVADIDAYAPFIQAVFGHAPSQRFLPFAISDLRASQTHPVLQAFLSLLSLPDSRFTNEEVLALLEVPSVAARFDIDEQGLRCLRQWVDESGIRWGLNDDNVRQMALPTTGQHTWRFGITRMLLGYAMESDCGDWQGILPYDESRGLIAELAGNLAELLMQLDQWRQQLSSMQTLEAWLPLCHKLLADFFVVDATTEAALELIKVQWHQVINDGIQAHYQQAISVTLLRDELSSRFDQQRISLRFLAGSINFCTLIPMRSIPFKVLCLLGMNDGVYPRTLPPLGFDLMSQQPRKGDRNRRDDDRYLFLEALLSAQQQLYISYIGRSIQDNSQRNPSVLVSELMSYIAQNFCLPGDENQGTDTSALRVEMYLQHQHSRTPFDAENFATNTQYRSFASEWLPAASGKGKAHSSFMQPLALPQLKELDFAQLVRFWRHPIRAFFNMRLSVNFSLEEIALPDTEPFAPDSLERYQINTQLLNALIDGKDSEQLFAYYRAAGELPYGAFGELFWQQQHDEMVTLAKQIREQRGSFSDREIDLQIDGVRLTGWISKIQHDGLLRWRPGELNFNDGLSLWLEHLIYCMLGGRGCSRMYGRKETQWAFLAIPSAEAKQEMIRFINGFHQGMSVPLLLTKSGATWLSSLYDNKNNELFVDDTRQAKAREKLLATWQGKYQMVGERSDPYLQRVLRELDEEHIQQMCHEAKHWLLPLLRFNTQLLSAPDADTASYLPLMQRL